ncbi:MAG: sulfatase-like hydrolase/transferase [Candidatus Binatia bacterium]|nr:sulfatase-like hydrolase/transferase [Candidatus Binatia bacterium]
MTGQPNIVLLCFECAPSGLFPSVSEEGPHDEWLRSLALDGLRFSRAYTNSPGTLESLASLWTGLWPAAHGVTCESPTRLLIVPTLPTRLSNVGYKTVGICPETELARRADIVQGLQECIAPRWRDRVVERVRAFGRAVAARRAVGGAPRSLWVNFTFFRWLDRTSQPLPFFAWLFYPVKHPEKSETSNLFRCDAPMCSNAARHVRDVVRALQTRGLWDTTILVVTALRGAVGSVEADLDPLAEELVRVPLFIRLPEPAPRGFVVEEFCQLSDVSPTLVYRAGGVWEENESRGRVLIRGNRATPGPACAVVEEYRGSMGSPVGGQRRRLLRTNQFRFVWRSDEAVKLYEAQAPGEQRDMALEQPQTVASLRAQLFAWLARQVDGSALELLPSETKNILARKGES